MPKLNDTQLVLMSAALQRDDRSIFPLPVALADAGDRATKAIATLIRVGFAEERETRVLLVQCEPLSPRCSGGFEVEAQLAINRHSASAAEWRSL